MSHSESSDSAKSSMPSAASPALPPSRPPLGLPVGSVRALLTLPIVGVVITQVARGRDLEPLWVETLMIALAHYFTSRRFINLPADVMRRLEAEGHVEPEGNPLFLPRFTIRALIVAAFAVLAAYTYREGRLFDLRTLSILGVVSAYLFGIFVRSLRAWWQRGREPTTLAGWEDFKAVVVLLVLFVTASAYLADRPELVPAQLRNMTLGLVLFYFGSR